MGGRDRRGLAESNAANSITINVIPKEGGNTFSARVNGIYSNSGLQSDNLTDELRARGLQTVNPIDYIFDFDASVGGPIRKDRLWFFTSHRVQGQRDATGWRVLQRDAGDAVLYTGSDRDRRSARISSSRTRSA